MIEWALLSFFRWVLNGMANFGYWICLLVAIGGHLAYVSGFKKGAKVSSFSIVIYAIVEAMAGAVR